MLSLEKQARANTSCSTKTAFKIEYVVLFMKLKHYVNYMYRDQSRI